jgi:hypothetical protein
MSAKIEAGCFVRRHGFQHSIPRFLGASRLGNHNAKRLSQTPSNTRQNPFDAIGIGVIEEEWSQAVGMRMAERVGNELWTQARPADSDNKQIFKIPALTFDCSGMYLRRKPLNPV